MVIKEEIKNSVIASKMDINTSKEKLWEVISTPGILKYCHPFCKENQVIEWGKVGAKDTIEYYNGLKLHRLFTEWNPGEGYKLLIGRGKYATAKVLWKIAAKANGMSSIEISIHLFTDVVLQKYPKIFRWLMRDLYLLPSMSKYVEDVVKGFKYYIETGIPVKKNQFRSNKMFSTTTS